MGELEKIKTFFYEKGYFDLKCAIMNAQNFSNLNGTILDLNLIELFSKELDSDDLNNLNDFGINVFNYKDKIIKDFENDCYSSYYNGAKLAVIKFL